MLIPIEFKKTLSVADSKVFEVQKAVWLIFTDQLNKSIRRIKLVKQVHSKNASNLLVNEFIVFSTSDPS
jgi:hypothetical protein